MVSFYRVPLFCALPAAGSFSDKTQKSGAAFAAPLGKNILLLFHIPIEEGDDLGAGAVVIRTEQAIADPAGDALVRRPCDRVGIVSADLYIAECISSADRRAARRTVQEGDDLSAGAGSVGAELTAARAAGDAVLNGPGHRFGIVGIRGDIGKAVHALGGGRSGSPPQEGDRLGAGTDAVGGEGGGAGAAGDALVHGPDHGVLIVGACGHVDEGILAGGGRSLERGLHGDLAGGHGEGILAVLLGQLDLLVLAVQNSEGIQHITLVGIDRQGDGGALGGSLVAGSHVTVLGILHGDRVGGDTAGTALGGIEGVAQDHAVRVVIVGGQGGADRGRLALDGVIGRLGGEYACAGGLQRDLCGVDRTGLELIADDKGRAVRSHPLGVCHGVGTVGGGGRSRSSVLDGLGNGQIFHLDAGQHGDRGVFVALCAAVNALLMLLALCIGGCRSVYLPLPVIVNPKKLSRDDFIGYGTATAEMLDFLAEVLRFGLSICVTGSTGSGKTTLMSWILSTIPNEKRIFTIENGCREFDLVKEDAEGNVINNVVHTVTRFSDDPKQNYDQERLLEFALTCNPDIVCVGEMKSAEAFAAQEAARTGHAVITTTHANSCKATYYRMVTLCTQKYDMGDKTLYNLVTEAFPIVLFVKKLEDNSRRVMEITECEILEDGTRQLHTLYRYHVSETSIQDGKVKVHGEFQKVSTISASLQKRLLENGMPPRLLERIAGGGVKLDTGKEETA